MAFLGHLHVDDIAGDDEWHEDYLIVDVGHTFSLGCDSLNPDILIKRQGFSLSTHINSLLLQQSNT